MKKFLKALILPWTSTAAFGALFTIIPPLNFLFYGYLLEVLHNAKLEKKLPYWNHLWKKFIKGIITSAIILLLFAPFSFVTSFSAYVRWLNVMFYPLFAALILILGIAPLYLMAPILLRYKTKGWKAAWNLKKAWQKSKNKHYFKHWLAGTIIMIAIITLTAIISNLVRPIALMGPISLSSLFTASLGQWWALVTAFTIYGHGLKRGVKMKKRKIIAQKETIKGIPLSLPVLALLILLIIAGSLGTYMWYASRQLPSVTSEDAFKQAVTNCQPAQYDLTLPNSILKLETRWCDVIDARVKQAPTTAKVLTDLGMRCRVPAKELQQINLASILNLPQYCEGELKRNPKRIMMLS